MSTGPAAPSPAPVFLSRARAGVLVALAIAGLALGGYEAYRYFRGDSAPRPMPADPESPAPCGPCGPSTPRERVRSRGRVEPANLAHLRALSFRRHGRRLQSLPPATEKDWDSRSQGWVGPVKNQAACGSCWDFSGTGVVEIAYNKAGIGGGPSTFVLSEQYTLSCGKNGGCHGDDNTTVLDWAKSTGLPLSADYGPYTASAGLFRRCGYDSSKPLYKIADWGFADSNGGQGVTPVQDIKNAVKAYGAVGCGVAANSEMEDWTPGKPFAGGGFGQHSINHDVIIVGWHDDASLPGGGSWIVRNSWGPDWGDHGYIEMCYGANDIGTEAVFAIPPGNPAPGPPQPGPPQPGPPPNPPTPSPLAIAGPDAVPAYGLVQLGLTGGSFTSAGWMVFPSTAVTSYTAPGGATFVFGGPPGTYEVGAYVQTAAGIATLQKAVTIRPSGPTPAPPAPVPPGPSPSPQVDPAFEQLGRDYKSALGPAYADAFEAGAKALESGQTLTAALTIVGRGWDAGRARLFAARLSPAFAKVVPESTPDANVTAAQRAAMGAAWRSFAAGLRN